MGINIGSRVIFWKKVLLDLGNKMTESLQNMLIEKDKNLNENNIRSGLASTKLKRSEQLQNRIIEQLK